jgi:hypothetical protein
MQLLTIGDGSAKLAKSDAAGTQYLSAICYLAPHKVAGFGNVCPNASAGCIAACLNTAGRGIYQKTQDARIARTKLWFEDRDTFKSQMTKEIHSFVKKCTAVGKVAAVRLNGTSDIPWEKQWPDLFELFPQVQFYDYTKNVKRMLAWAKGEMPANYHLTFSRSEVNEDKCREVLKAGGNVAVVFSTDIFPSTYLGRPVFDADEDDLRFLDAKGTIQALKAKGKAKKDLSGFVVKL